MAVEISFSRPPYRLNSRLFRLDEIGVSGIGDPNRSLDFRVNGASKPKQDLQSSFPSELCWAPILYGFLLQAREFRLSKDATARKSWVLTKSACPFQWWCYHSEVVKVFLTSNYERKVSFQVQCAGSRNFLFEQ